MNEKNGRKRVVITGASSGIGRACALRLAQLDFDVFAGVRREEDGMAIQREIAGRITPLILDVTDHASVLRSAKSMERACGDEGIWGLVNNAGIVIGGPLEFLPLDEIRKQFEVNLFGQITVTQAFLPLLRACRGRIVNMGSISGRVATPFVGPYGASKHALEAISDALRVELAPWGIAVSVIEPGSIATPIWDKSIGAAEEVVKRLPREVYELYGTAMEKIKGAAKRQGDAGIPPERVTRAVIHALSARRPRTRYLVGSGARIQAVLKRFLPDRVLDRLVMRHLDLR